MLLNNQLPRKLSSNEDCRIWPLISEQLLQCSYEWLRSERQTVTDTLASSCAEAPSDSFAVLLIISYEELVGSKVKDFWGQKKGLKHTAICYKNEIKTQTGESNIMFSPDK